MHPTWGKVALLATGGEGNMRCLKKRVFAMIIMAAAFIGNGIGMAAAMTNTAYDFQFTAIDGDKLDLADYRGKVLLVVNTASQCGFTSQYDGLEAIWQKYKDQGLVVIGVPSNDFGKQEPGTADEIKSFCEVNFNISFPMTDKQVVKGTNAHPFYQWVSAEAGLMGKPRWNFHKYLIGRDGRFVTWFASTTTPESNKLQTAITSALAE
jgi:glutathione peroxidase